MCTGGCILLDILANQADAVDLSDVEVDAVPEAAGEGNAPSPELLSFDVEDSDDEDGAEPGNDAQSGEGATDDNPSVERFLEHIGLSDLAPQLVNEDVTDFETLKTCTEQDLADLGISLGKRKKIASGVAAWSAEQAAKVQTQAADREAARLQREQRRLDRRRAAAEAAYRAAQKAIFQSQKQKEASSIATGPYKLRYPKIEAEFAACFLLGCPYGVPAGGRSHCTSSLCSPTCHEPKPSLIRCTRSTSAH
eukprot:m.104041 g.104041  ORF g.104041 m.104041 type:complete len:251 (-) comp9091_c0_seq1:4265-5017(-)